MTLSSKSSENFHNFINKKLVVSIFVTNRFERYWKVYYCIRKNFIALKVRKAAKWPRTFYMVWTVSCHNLYLDRCFGLGGGVISSQVFYAQLNQNKISFHFAVWITKRLPQICDKRTGQIQSKRWQIGRPDAGRGAQADQGGKTTPEKSQLEVQNGTRDERTDESRGF